MLLYTFSELQVAVSEYDTHDLCSSRAIDNAATYVVEAKRTWKLVSKLNRPTIFFQAPSN